MGQIRVDRWAFWSGVLLLVATIVLDALYGQQTNPPYGTGWDFVPLSVTIALALLLVSAATGSGRVADARDGRTDAPGGTR
jgi:hypothetical protein